VVDRHDQQDDRRADEVADDRGEHRRGEQDQDQAVAQLPDDRAPERGRWVHLHLVRPVPDQAGGGGALVQAGRRDDALLIDDLHG
jgi:hypothetical protein